MKREKNAAKNDGAKNAGGGKAGMEVRKGGDMKAEMEKAAAERAAIKAKREEKEKAKAGK